MTNFARVFDVAADDSFTQLVTFAAKLMTGGGPGAFLQRVETVRAGRSRLAQSSAETAAVNFQYEPTMAGAAHLLSELSGQQGNRVYRPDALRCCIAAMQSSVEMGVTFHAASLLMRERNRYVGRPLGGRSVGSTLLLKGLEADVAVILYPETFDANNLYVAMTRAAH